LATYKIIKAGVYQAWAAPHDPHSSIAITATDPGPAGETRIVAHDIRETPRIAGAPESHPSATSGDLTAAADTELRTDPAAADLKVYALPGPTLIHDSTTV
jgi:hypothetical protein